MKAKELANQYFPYMTTGIAVKLLLDSKRITNEQYQEYRQQR
jgi:hypothetical protein